MVNRRRRGQMQLYPYRIDKLRRSSRLDKKFKAKIAAYEEERRAKRKASVKKRLDENENENNNKPISKVPLISIGHLLIEFLEDHFTLTRLGRTNRAFYGLVFHSRPSLRNKWFDLMELSRHPLTYNAWTPITIPPTKHYEALCHYTLTELVYPVLFDPRMPYQKISQRKIGQHMGATDICLLGSLNFRNVFLSKRFPCYGCRVFKEKHMFSDDHVSSHRMLCGCKAFERRCLDCLAQEESGSVLHAPSVALGAP